MISIRSIRLSLRFIVPLVIALTLLAYAVVPLVDKLNLRWSVRDMDIRSRLIANTLHDPLDELLHQGNKARINTLLLRAIQDERLLAIGYCDGNSKLLYRTPTFPESLGCSSALSLLNKGASPLLLLPQGAVHVAIHPMDQDGVQNGSLILVHDMSFVERRSADTRRYIILLFAVLGVIISVITVFVAHLSWRGWMDGVRAMLRGEGILKPFSQPAVASELQPLVGDLRTLLRTLDAKRRFADDATITWSPDSLRKLLHKELAGERIIVVSNREPYIHIREGERIEVHRPASGLVTAVEPVVRACSGTWIAHGGGAADRETVDKYDRVQVPPEHPEYTLRRIWLTKQEENGYYYGFANEGLWPLCHIAHVRPIFRSTDWRQYVAINQRFADAVVTEADS
jgi:trehalose 6-phosphate synthase